MFNFSVQRVREPERLRMRDRLLFEINQHAQTKTKQSKLKLMVHILYLW